MSAYLIEVDDTDLGVCSPRIVGPFPDVATACVFAEEHAMGISAQMRGGYSAVHVIADETCNKTPEEYSEEYRERHCEECDEE